MNDMANLAGRSAEEQQKAILATAGIHIMVYAGNGNGRPAELLFSSGDEHESKSLCYMMANMIENRKRAKTITPARP